MKKALVIIATLVCIIFTMSACGSKEVTHVGVNAEILEINTELKGFVVKSLDDDSILGEKCYVSCESEELYYLYVDYDTSEITDLSYSDFTVGDHITVDVISVENKYTVTSRIQLLTQRL